MKKMTVVLGITGGIATGKSTVSEIFQSHNIPVIDADQIAREIMMPNSLALNQIKKVFGSEVFCSNGELDRQKLGQIIFYSQEKRQQLNHITGPLIRKIILSRREEYLKEKVPVLVLDIPLLYESNYLAYVDLTLVVYVPKEVQLERLMERDGITKEEAMRKITSQMPIEKKKELADIVVNNEYDKAELVRRVETIISKLLQK